MRQILSILFLFALLFGCSGSTKDDLPIAEDTGIQPHYHIVIDRRFNDNQQSAILFALTEWNQKTNGMLQYDVRYQLIEDNTRPGDDNTINVINQDPGVGLAGWTEWDDTANTAMVLLKSELGDTLFFAACLHEFGHAFHLGHTTACVPSVMHPYLGDFNHLECYDIQQFCSIWNCQIDCVVGRDLYCNTERNPLQLSQ